jgi:predicted RNA-binding Zn-ribbon protein involved in translation (DUF1610 family)
MNFDIEITPNDEEEVALLEMLAEAREFGLTETAMSESELAALFAQFASGLHTETPDDEGAGFDCPICGKAVRDVEARGMGQPPMLNPCRHEATWDGIPVDFVDER